MKQNRCRERKQQDREQPSLRSLSPYSVPLSTNADDNKVTRRPPLPQKLQTTAKPGKVKTNEDTIYIHENVQQQTRKTKAGNNERTKSLKRKFLQVY